MNQKSLSSVKTSYKAIIASLGLCAVIYLYYIGSGIIQLVAVALFLVVLYLWTETLESFADFQLKKEKWLLNIIVGVIIGLAMFIIYMGYKRLDLSRLQFNASIFAAVTVVAAAEEFFFRGYLQGKLAKDFGIVPRIVIVTILFGVYKISVFSSMRTFLSLAEIVAISCLGSIILSIQMEKMQNLLSPVISHVLWDNLVYSNMGAVPSWITTSPQWTETLYHYLYKFSGLFCSQWNLSSYSVVGKQFVMCSGCAGIFLGVFFAFFLYEKNLFTKLHTMKFYAPALIPEISLWAGLNILTWAKILNPNLLSGAQLQIINYSYTFFGLLLGFAGSVLMVNVISGQNEKWENRMENWLKDYEFLVIPALLLAFLSNPLSNPQMTALIFFSILAVMGFVTAVVFAAFLILSGLEK
jgi:membrane protease YdiL (CAAX protease family)